MFKVISDRSEFIENPILEMNEKQIESAKTDLITLCGKEYRMYADDWKHHVHIKCTDRCDSKCKFCIEWSERGNPQNPGRVLESTKLILSELYQQGHLKTVSITGGEPTVFKELPSLVEYIEKFPLVLFSINTNGRYLDHIPKFFTGWVNISKHSIDDSLVFGRDFNIEPNLISKFKETHPGAKVRLQCVLGGGSMKSIPEILEFIEYFKDVVDDFSFRNLILVDDNSKVNDLFLDLRKNLYEAGNFVEQVIQDYYVYETYGILGTMVTLSWSNMKELREYNESHDSNFLEEIIIHPDGIVSGSWNKKSLIIYDYDKRNE